MRKKITLLFVITSLLSYSQQTKGILGNENWLNNWTNFKPKAAEYNETTTILNGVIDKNTILSKKHTYLLNGVVYVVNNAILTIEPGTVIRGDFDSCGTLVITKGAKIIAEGEVTNPIVFTSNKESSSRKPGDWGGIILLGEAPINKFGGASTLDFNLDPKLSIYGGNNPQDDSGIMKYVRIEFCGRKINTKKELNGLSLAGVGSKTKVDFIQISYSNDDAIECYGGNTILNNLVSYRATDDDFDFTQGAQCSINNSVAIRYPYSSDISGSRCFELDCYDKIENSDPNQKSTQVIANNITLVNFEENSQGLIREAIHIKDNANFILKNSIVSGFNQVMILDKNIPILSVNLDKIKFENVLFNNCKGTIESENKMNKELEMWYSNEKLNIETSDINISDLFINTDFRKNIDLRYKNNNLKMSVLKTN